MSSIVCLYEVSFQVMSHLTSQITITLHKHLVLQITIPFKLIYQILKYNKFFQSCCPCTPKDNIIHIISLK